MSGTRHPKLTKEAQEEAVLAFARCRASARHTLEPIPAPPGTPRPTFGSLIVQRCVVCGTLAYDKVSRVSGQRIAPRTYDHPLGYKDLERHDISWWRATWYDTLDRDLFLDAAPPAKNRGNVTPMRRRRRAS